MPVFSAGKMGFVVSGTENQKNKKKWKWRFGNKK